MTDQDRLTIVNRLAIQASFCKLATVLTVGFALLATYSFTIPVFASLGLLVLVLGYLDSLLIINIMMIHGLK